MKILHIITRMILGGAQENTMLSVLGQDARAGVEASLLTGPTEGPEGSLVESMQDRGGRVRLEPALCREVAPLRDMRALRALRGRIRDLKPDVVHTHSSKAGILGRMAAWAEGVPLVVHTIHGLPFHPYLPIWKNHAYIAAERLAARRCHRIVSVADAMTEQALARGVGRPEQYTTVYSGMEVEPFLCEDRDPVALRGRWGLAPDDVVIGKVARLFEFKGHEYLFEAFGRILEEEPRARLFLVGDGIWRGRFEEEVRQAGFAHRVTFAGLVPREELPRAMAAMDLVVHCSLREGLARVLPQGYLAGKPVVSFDVDGAREVVRPGQTGWLVPPRNVDALADAIGEALASPGEARRRAMAGRALCRERFDWHRMVADLLRIYEEGLARNAGPGCDRGDPVG